MKFKVNTPTAHEKFCADIDNILSQLPNDMASTELLNSNIFGRIFVSLADTFTGVAKTLYANFANFTKTLKRSELREFVESNRMKVNIVDRIPFAKMAEVQVDVPANLRGTYKEVIIDLSKCYLTLNALNTAKLVESTVTEVFKSVTSDKNKIGDTVRKGTVLVLHAVSAAKTAVQSINARFAGEFKTKVAFSSLFPTQLEYANARKSLIDLDGRLQDAQPIAESIKIIESTLKGISNVLTSGSESATLTKEDLIRFGEMLKQADLIFSSFGMCTTRHLALEHNYCLITNTIYSTCK